ncbi:pyrrolysine--tRNA(Pyl) ligase large subunit [Candidatus Borrarchaeum sp.]|uniref:pyrrolysine--tRNA(Pyl) ligase large subunit n=1 Tax=Candidatus Borrarchaeum sp. TaxID=2846742 RepID=UPI00257FB927|nr:pyrrolysine--tRNA(Pyl) ligase large subunit [Candidatus Borrarchaeum sp.]
MAFIFSKTQQQRLKELDAPDEFFLLSFETKSERDKRFQEISTSLEKYHRENLMNFLMFKKPELKRIEQALEKAAISEGFVEVLTPVIISKSFIKRMEIKENHSLWKQIFWLDESRCLRPMLAPGLYHLMSQLRKFVNPVKIFEIGQCFRKETTGQQHLEEFTMMNLVEYGDILEPEKRINYMIDLIMKNVGLKEYKVHQVDSLVYGTTIDVSIEGVEIASAAIGPHPLDKNWNVYEPWAGIGVGIERLILLKENFKNIKRISRSLSYLNGWRLDI